MRPTRTHVAVAAAATALALLLTGCAQSAPAQPEQSEAPAEAAVWPRTIEIPAGREHAASTLTIEAEPQAIAALDYESAEVLAELGLSDRVVLVPEAVLNPALGTHIEELSAVPNTFPTAMEIEAETVISMAPDLVVMSPRHGNEAPIAEVLGASGIAALQLPAPWTSPATLATNIELIGEATGTEGPAAELTASLEAGLVPQASGGPEKRVLVLTNQAGRPFVTAGSAFPLELLSLAGAQNVAVELGIERTGPISAEQIVQADPDGIVLIDMNGTGDRMFSELLANPAVAGVPAVAEDRLLRVEGKQVQALGLTGTIDGLGVLSEWVAGLPAG